MLALLALGVALLLAGMTPTAEAQSRFIDYDLDDDNLIEVRSLEQLNAIRYSLYAISAPAAYKAAFPRGEYRSGSPRNDQTMGCPTSLRYCFGYELAADLDFDTNGDGEITEADGAISWNGGKGWVPLPTFSANFQGNGYTISNMMINSDAEQSVGLFSRVASSGIILGTQSVTGVALLDVDITASYDGGPVGGSIDDFDVGGLAGVATRNYVRGSYVTGRITTTAAGNATTHAGGLVGRAANQAHIAASWAEVAVTANAGALTSTSDNVGGLIGYATTGSGETRVTASYAKGAVTAKRDLSNAAGLIGSVQRATVTACYAIGSVTNEGTGNDADAGGLVGGGALSTVTASYWATDTTGQMNSPGGGTARTAAQLQTPTEYGTGPTDIYRTWNVDVDNADNDNSLTSGPDDPWRFGGSSDYPSLLAYHQAFASPSVRPPQAPPAPPVANAGADINTFAGQLVRLDGTGSAASAGAGDLAYEWLQVWSDGNDRELPANHDNKVALSDASVARPTFTAPETVPEGGVTLTFRLEVHDGTYYAEPPDWVRVTVGPAQPNQLTELSVIAGGGTRPLTPAFVPATTGPYSASVGAYTTTARVTVAAAEEGATISFNDRMVKLDDELAGSVIVHLAEGKNFSTIVVTPPEPDPEEMPEPPPTDPNVTPEPPLEPTTYFLNIRRQPVPRLKFEPARLLMDEGATATYTVDLDTRWLGSEVTVRISSGDPDVTVSPDTVSFRPTDWAPREVTVTVGQDDDGENEVVTLDHAASGGHFDRVYGRLRVEITDDDAGTVTPTPAPTATPVPGTPVPTPTPTPLPGLPTAPTDSEQTLTLDGQTVTITRQAGSLAGVTVALPSVLTRDLEITIAPLLAGIPLSSERFGLGMTDAAQSGATLTVVGVPAGGLEICLPLSGSLVSEAGARSLTLVRYGGAGWEALPDAARRGMSVCASGVSTGVFAAAYIIPPPPQLGPASNLTATPGADPGTLILRWTPGQDATRHWIAGIKQSDLAAGDTSNLIWTAASASNTHTLTGLESGAEYAFAIAAGRGSEWSSWTPLARGTPD